jgi:hypothetical protein
MECKFNRTHIKEDLKITRGIRTSQPRCNQGSTRKTPSRRNSEEPEDAFRSTREPAVLDYEELGGLFRPAATGLCTSHRLSRIRDGTWPTLTSIVTTHTGVGLVGRRKLPE